MGTPAVTRQGNGAKRLAIWICLLGLPLAYEASTLLSGPGRFYSGDIWYWFSGFQVRLALTAIGAASVAWALRRSGERLTDIGWPRRLRWWEVLGIVAVLAGAAAVALQHPAHVSTQVAFVTASTPATPLERWALLLLAVVEALVQETIWRGALITWLEPSLGRFGAALVSAASFSFYHPGFTFNGVQLAVAALVAVVYTLLFLWRRSIGPSAFLHFVLTAGQLLAPV